VKDPTEKGWRIPWSEGHGLVLAGAGRSDEDGIAIISPLALLLCIGVWAHVLY